MDELTQALRIIDALRGGTCWCPKSDPTSGYFTHTSICHGAIALLEKYGFYVPDEAKK